MCSSRVVWKFFPEASHHLFEALGSLEHFPGTGGLSAPGMETQQMKGNRGGDASSVARGAMEGRVTLLARIFHTAMGRFLSAPGAG